MNIILEHEPSVAPDSSIRNMDSTIDHDTEDAVLRRTLAALGMKAFTNVSVEKYKRRKRYDESSKVMLFLRATFLDFVVGIAAAVALLAAPVSFVFVVGTIILANRIPQFAAFLCIGSLAVLWAALRMDRLTLGEWTEISWQKFDDPVPERVRGRVESVLAEMPNLNIYVEKLTMTRDPLVFALIEGKRTYFEVWDEKDFEPQYQSPT